ncbi:MAG: type II toxin-antitoxin system VapB family antitoxin [bacterium]
MPLNIKNPEAHKIAKELSELTGKSITEVVTDALKNALDRERGLLEDSRARLVHDLDEIAEFCSSLPVLDARSPAEIIGFDENGGLS